MNAVWRVGLDIGGTFTDVFAIHRKTGEHRVAKVRSYREEPFSSLLAGINAIRIGWDDISEIVHGTTMVTNLIVEHKLNSVALIATKGFADTIEIGRQNRLHLYRLDLLPKVDPLVPEECRFEVSERIDYTGKVLQKLTDNNIKNVLLQIIKAEPDAVAVSLLHAYVNPKHERKLAEGLKKLNTNISLSHEVNPVEREYERTSTTVLSASVMKPVSAYLDQIEEYKTANNDFSFFHSAGGMITPDVVRRLPLSLAFSGPAAGVSAAVEITRHFKSDQAISFDMGGTTTDVCMINQGQADVRNERTLNGRSLRMPMVAVESIGAGGGSIARLDMGVLRVGPESAGAEPGPACYSRGGTQSTVTDANLVLGYLSPDHQLGDGTKLDLDAAEMALSLVANEIGLTIYKLALGILDVANANMIRALRRITVDRGIDGRECVLLAYGGAGPIHAVELARAFGISTVIIPNHSSVFSAFGCAYAQKSFSVQQTVRMKSSCWDEEKVTEYRNDIIERLLKAFKDDETATVQFDDVAAIRYIGQSYSIEINDADINNPDRLGKAFKTLHQSLYGFATDDEWELVTLRIRASLTSGMTSQKKEFVGRTDFNVSTQIAPCWFEADHAVITPRFNRLNLSPNSFIEGPAVIEDKWSTTVLPPGSRLNVDSYGHMIISVETAI